MTTEPTPVFDRDESEAEERPYAGPAVRLLAFLLDGLCLTIVSFLVSVPVAFVLEVFSPGTIGDWTTSYDAVDAGWTGWAIYVVGSAILLLWFGAWQSGLGASPGMLLCKLRVVDPNGRSRPSFRAAVIRNCPQTLLYFGSLTGIAAVDAVLAVITLGGYIAIGVSISNSPTRQGFHDRLAGGTFVVRKPRRHPSDGGRIQ
ncbi:RDD family protein [Mycolicibacterium hippocampi]|uniref:RDD domain-containing protein n=1 Tax=Mycolicibacterium hippocampi TaxID=659824 RepID=A0A850PGK1_9MYCO|nr:RDD family protein [Mycolicibacterium hippocampi]NVN49509.1 hypothetical protein [Mycolicibacterium hippocampi]